MMWIPPLLGYAMAYAFAFWTGWRLEGAARQLRMRVLVIFAVVAPVLGSVFGLITIFGAVAETDPSEKASLLAAGIAETINCFAFFLLLDVGLFVLLAVGASLRRVR